MGARGHFLRQEQMRKNHIFRGILIIITLAVFTIGFAFGWSANAKQDQKYDTTTLRCISSAECENGNQIPYREVIEFVITETK